MLAKSSGLESERTEENFCVVLTYLLIKADE